ncbi:hypothetical protein AB0J90_06860 [Micromonospora sp. NPDC049523]|uniref:hypothetical protein n=1 Tax=Micromonospora sp. NPDC049523 TaxID=3155921 RepID=UPI00341C56E4
MPPAMPPEPPPRPTPGTAWAAGPVTRLGGPPVAAPSAVAPPAPVGRERYRLWWFAGTAGAVLVAGLAVVLAMTLGSDPHLFGDDFSAPADTRPPLARMCPPASALPPGGSPTASPPDAPSPQATALPTTPRSAAPGGSPSVGPRTVDEEAGISYTEYGAPWLPWDAEWNAGMLEVPYKVGQHFVTEPSYDGFSDYHASILSAAVPAAENDALTFDLECVGRQVAADVRAEYYPQPSRMELFRDERTMLGGRPAWVTVFRLHFSRAGLKATDELAAVACIDVGRATAAIFYVSIPGTHRELDWVVDDALASVRPI